MKPWESAMCWVDYCSTKFAKGLIRSSNFLSSALVAVVTACWGQLTTGTLEVLRLPEGTPIRVEGSPGSAIEVRSNKSGQSDLTLPYGAYRITVGTIITGVYVAPLEVTRLILENGRSVVIAPPRPQGYVGSPSLHGLLLALEPATVAEPLDFNGLGSMRLPLVSLRAYSWTETRSTLDGLNATDAWQPGRSAMVPDVQGLGDVSTRDSRIGLFLREPSAQWHAELSSANTGTALTSDNLPRPVTRGALRQSEHFNWFTRDNLQAGGAVGPRIDLFLSGTGQWASQTVPVSNARPAMKTRMLYGNARGRIQITDRDQVEAHFSGSQIHLSNWGMPAGLEALAGRRMSPELNAPWGFRDLEETDHLNSIQAAWTRQLAVGGRAGVLQVRYGFAPMHLDTGTADRAPSRIELADSSVRGSPPLENLAVRRRHELAAGFEPGVFEFLGRRHRIAAGGGWESAKIRNQFNVPGGMGLITANGAPAFIAEFNGPQDGRTGVRDASAYVRDHIWVNAWLSADAAVSGDFARGGMPTRANLIAWNSASPQVGLAITPPLLHGVVIGGGYARCYEPLAGRYLDFGNPSSLGGLEYQWLANGERGPLMLRFGGPYSAIDNHLRQPYADEFQLRAEISLPGRTRASVRVFRSDEKSRIAAIDTGVPLSGFRPVQIVDSGPDSISGTFDDQVLTVYAQDPATFGKDQYLLTNPAGLHTLYEGVVAEVGGGWRLVGVHASFMAVRAWGPTNPGNSPLENDPGVIGAWLADPNTAIHAAGHAYFDRAFVGKLQLTARLPPLYGGIEIANTANYLDGLPFARRLLVTGLPQGPMLVATTIRGSPEGGNRSEFAINWNLRISRTMALPYGSLAVGVEVLNVTNASNRLQENDISGPVFNQRLPIAIEAPRFLRFDVRYRF
jgi:hypothetical protein